MRSSIAAVLFASALVPVAHAQAGVAKGFLLVPNTGGCKHIIVAGSQLLPQPGDDDDTTNWWACIPGGAKVSYGLVCYRINRADDVAKDGLLQSCGDKPCAESISKRQPHHFVAPGSREYGNDYFRLTVEDPRTYTLLTDFYSGGFTAKDGHHIPYVRATRLCTGHTAPMPDELERAIHAQLNETLPKPSSFP